MAKSTYVEGNSRTFKAGADLSAKQFTIVKADSTDNQVVSAADATTGILLGVLMNTPKSGDTADVYLRNGAGTGKVKAGGTLAVGDALTANASGLAIATTTGNDQVIGYAAHIAATNDIVEFYPAGFTRVR